MNISLYAEYAKNFFGEGNLHGIPGKAQFIVNAALKMMQAVPAAVPGWALTSCLNITKA